MRSLTLPQEFRTLQKQNPVSCGAWLQALQVKHQVNQTQLAEMLEASRQVIGRYIRGAKGEKVAVPKAKKPAPEPSKPTPVEPPKEQAPEPETMQAPEPQPEPTRPEPEAGAITWGGLLRNLITPAPFFCSLAVIGLTSYLIQQSILFFSHVETAQHSIISNAILSEAIPLIAAACFAMSFKPMHKWVLGLILGGSILGMGFFMHASIGHQMIQQSTISKQTELERQALNSSLMALSGGLKALPAKYVSKRQELIKQMNFQRAELSSLKIKTAGISQAISLTSNAAFSFGVWLRVAAMLLNALLVHWVVGSLRLSAMFLM